MGQARRRLLFFAAAATAAVACAFPGAAGAAPSCASRLIADWRDGRIDGTYPVACYREALSSLPEDLRIYSSAQSDIARALQNRVRVERTAARTTAPSDNGGGGVSPYLVAVISVALALSAATVVTLTR